MARLSRPAVVAVIGLAISAAFVIGLFRFVASESSEPAGPLTAAIIDQASLTQPNPALAESASAILERAGYTVDYYPGADAIVDFSIYIDPSGTVRTLGGDPIAAATVTLYRSDNSSGPFEAVPNGSVIMAPTNRNNPDATDADGRFSWAVIAGFYVVRAEMAGCVLPTDPSQAFVETEVLTIPPAVIDIELRLDCGTPPPPLGGAGVFPEVPGAGGSSSLSNGVLAGVFAAVTAGAIALGGAAWYARRRSAS